MDFDKAYKDSPKFFSTGKTDLQVVEAVKKLGRGKKVLELGSGQGEVALSIAAAGFEVLATDSSTVGIEQIKKKAVEQHLPNLKAEVSDMRSGVPGVFDAIVCIRSLHYLYREEGLNLISQIKGHTNSGGINAIVALTQEGEFYTMSSEKGRFYVAPQEMRELYKDWEIIEYSEDWDYSKWKNARGERAKNYRATLIAIKP